MKRHKKLIVGLAATVGATACGMLASGVAGAQGGASAEVALLGTQVNLLWVVLGAVLVIFMQAGFALVETGFCRAKHASHVVSTNFAIFGLGFIGFFLVGWPLMFGGYTLPLLGIDTPTGTNLLGSGNWVFLKASNKLPVATSNPVIIGMNVFVGMCMRLSHRVTTNWYLPDPIFNVTNPFSVPVTSISVEAESALPLS